MSRIQCAASLACAQDLTSSVGRLIDRRLTGRAKPVQSRTRDKQTDKESGFESCPNSPRAEAPVETGHQCQCGAQKELRHQTGDCASLECFKFIKKLGSGGYGSVVLVEKRRGHDRGALYALKMTSLNRAALVERDILPRLQNVPYTTDLAYAFFTPSPPKAFLALPYAIGKDLFSLAGAGSRAGYLRKMFVLAYPHYVDRIRVVLAELSAAIRSLHKHRILYRDLKLENILVSGDGHIRLADFGLSRHFEAGESTLITGKTGTPDYMAPEVIRSSGNHGAPTQYSFEADLWGLGVIAYELIVGQLPFKGPEVADLEESILNDPVELPHGYVEEKLRVLLSHEKPMVLAALSFVRGLLQRNPRDRLTVDELPSHVFFRDLDWTAIESGRHDDPPFDIRRVVRELTPDESPARLPSAFSGVPSEKKERRDKAGNSSFENPAKYKNYHYCSSEFSWYDADLENAVRVDSGVVPRGAIVDDDDGQWDAEAGTPLDEVPGLVAFELAAVEPPWPASPDSACGEEPLPVCPASPAADDGDSEKEESERSPSWGVAGRGRLPSHPESPSASEASDEEELAACRVESPRGVARQRATGGYVVDMFPSDEEELAACRVESPRGVARQRATGGYVVDMFPSDDDELAACRVESPRGVARQRATGGYLVDMFPRVRRAAKRLRSQRRLSFDQLRPGLTLDLTSALTAALPADSYSEARGSPVSPASPPWLAPSDGLPPKKRRRFLQPAAAEPRVLVQPQPPLPPFSSLRHRAAEHC